MKKFFTRFLIVIPLLLGSLFAATTFSTPVLADEDDTTSTSPVDTPDLDLGNTLQPTDPQDDSQPTAQPSVDDATPEATDPSTTDPAEGTTDPETTDGTTEDTADGEEAGEEAEEETEELSVCSSEVQGLSWILCTATNVVAKATDVIYSIVEDLLQINPATLEETSPIYLVWQYARNLTNIVFIIFLLIVIYSQLTGLGLSNYGVKRVLPRLIIAIVLVNLSFIICLLAVDLSNIIGASLRGFFGSIEETILAGTTIVPDELSFGSVLTWLTVGGSAVGGLAALAATNSLGSIFWMAVIAAFGAIAAVITGLITIAARQALVALLIMISPLAFVAYLLPNTERWFSKWKDLLLRMLIFYPMFSFLFGASHLAGLSIMASATGDAAALWIILGLAVQVFPLFFAWQLLKMSGTILGAISSGVSRALAPVQRGIGGWATSHAERSRQNYLANSTMPGAKLRRYLDYRQKLRTTDTANSATIRSSIATERAMRVLSSEAGRDAQGNDTWKKRANRYTRNAKRSSIEAIRAQAAELSHANTISAYKFSSTPTDARLGRASGQAYLEYTVQKYREANEAQSDQTWLLNQYLDAAKNVNENPYEYNRLIRNGAGSLAHLGETSIMGQVIVKNSEIEERRRREGRIVFTKFGMNKHKAEFRGMVFDAEHINDDGYETDEHGVTVEDSQYRLKAGKQHTPWSRFIGVHKTTGAEITSTEYNALSEAERKNYNKVNYFDITDDAGKPVQRVYTDDAGYMKELLIDDIAIGDPINQRYQIELGVSNLPGKGNGILRSYHSTITAAFGSTGYKEHDASVTAQLTAQLNAGYVNSIGQLYIAKLESIKNATKPGAFLINDSFFQKQLTQLLLASQDETAFANLIDDQDIEHYANVNGASLRGAKWVTDPDGSNGHWEKVDREKATLQERKDFIKHMLIPDVAQKVFGLMNRKPSNNTADSQKPDAAAALDDLLTAIVQLQSTNDNAEIPAEQRLNPGVNLYKSGDPYAVKRRIDNILNQLPPEDDEDDDDDYGSGGSPSAGGGRPRGPQGGGGFTPASGRDSYGSFGQRLGRSKDYMSRSDRQNDPVAIEAVVDDIFTLNSFQQIANELIGLFDTTPALRKGRDQLNQLISVYREQLHPQTTLDGIQQMVDGDDPELLANFHRDIDDLINQCLFGS